MASFFSEIFEVDKAKLDSYGAFDVSLLTDLPLFIDPFLLFDSEENKYIEWHNELVVYLKYLKEKSVRGKLTPKVIDYYYRFPEVKQNWLGFTAFGNEGHGLGPSFATSLNDNLSKLFNDFGEEKVTKGSHIEKLCLIKDGVGKDSISDFTTNIVKKFLLEYTEKFAIQHINPKHLQRRIVRRAYFDFETGAWMPKRYMLPIHDNDFVILTPKDILTQDQSWINRNDLYGDFEDIPPTIENEELRYGISKHFYGQLNRKNTAEDRKAAAVATVQEYPQVIDYYIKSKEDNASKAHVTSDVKVVKTDKIFREILPELSSGLHEQSNFYELSDNSYEECLRKIGQFKNYIENNDGYKVIGAALKVTRTEDVVQLFFGLAWLDSTYDVNREVNNGRGPVDFKVSKGSTNKTIIEFKLGSNTSLKRNLQKQAEIYGAANNTQNIIKVIFVSTEEESKSVKRILDELKMTNLENVIVIDARSDNKPSASVA
jgi:hypothetical protein